MSTTEVTEKNIALIQSQIKDILSGKDFDYTTQELIENFLIPLDAQYHSNGDVESVITDSEYDALYNIVRAMAPTNVYFTGVGSDVRGEKVTLPYPMGSLDQVYETDLVEWIEQKELEDETIVITEKLDGISSMLIYNEVGNLQIAYSRGNGREGADITRHVRKIQSVPLSNPQLAGCAVRAEIIVSHANFKTLQGMIKTRSNKRYKNARNLIAGLMNAKENNDSVYDYIDVVGYEIINKSLGKDDQLNILHYCGLQTPWMVSHIGFQLRPEKLTEYIKDRKTNGQYEIDGVVLDVESVETRIELNPTRDTFNPAYSVKYKVLDINNVKRAIVKGVEWNISKHGFLKPKVVFEEVEMAGVTIKHATGFNAKFIFDNNINAGAVVELVRSGDVIPFIQKVVVQAENPNIPENLGDWDWNETKVDIILTNPENVPEVKTQQLIDFFAELNIAHLREGNIRKFAKYSGSLSILDFISADSKDWQLAIGTVGKKIYDSIQHRFSNIAIHELMGATSLFGRGLGKRKFKLLLQSIPFDRLVSSSPEDIALVEGFDIKTANKIIGGLPKFIDWISSLPEYVNITYGTNAAEGKLKGHKICFTGFRDNVLSERVEALGGTMQSAVSSKTTYLVASNPNSTSSKMKKARSIPGINIFSIEEFKSFLNQ